MEKSIMLNKSFQSRFRAFRNPNQALPSGILTQVQLNSIGFDPLNEFDQAIGFDFIPIETGYYYLTVTIHLSATPIGVLISAQLQRNLGTIGQLNKWSINVLPETLFLSDIYYLIRGDSLTVWVRQNSGFAETIRAGTYGTSFTGFRVG